MIQGSTAQVSSWGQHPEKRYPRDEDSIGMTSTTNRTSEPARRFRALSLSLHTHRAALRKHKNVEHV